MDKHLYNKIYNSSNWYYNRGLVKAQIHDLSGAIEDLQTAIKYNKRNMDARNLLGLVYFEIGEVCQALCQWTISNSFQPVGNLAAEYLQLVKADEAGVEHINSTVRKFNQALIHAKHNSDDLAIIQLKQVIELMPNHLQAHLLLSLLYMRGGQYTQARKTLRIVLRMDVNNLDALRYMDEVRKKLRENNGRRIVRQDKLDIENEPLQRRFFLSEEEEEEYTKRNYFYTVFGIVIGVLFMAVLILPNAKERAILKSGETSKHYESKIESLEKVVVDLQKTNAKNQEELEKYSAVPEDYFEKIANMLFDEAYSLYEIGSYTDALEKFTEAYKINPQYGRALFFMGKMNHLTGKYEDAKIHFQQVIEKFPNTEQSEEAERLMNEMNQS